MLDELDKLISGFPGVEADWTGKQWVAYWLCNHRNLWVAIFTDRTTHLLLRWRLQKSFQLPPDLAGQLGVREEDVVIGAPDHPKGMKGVCVWIGKNFNTDPEALRRFLEALRRFLKEAHGSALNVWR